MSDLWIHSLGDKSYVQTLQSENARKRLLQDTKVAVKQVVALSLKDLVGDNDATTNTITDDDNAAVVSLCKALEDVLRHGLRERVRSVWVFIEGIMVHPDGSESLDVLRTLSEIHTIDGRLRAWLRRALNQANLVAFLQCLIENRERVHTHYEDYAFLSHEEECNIFSALLMGISHVHFTLSYNEAGLNTSPDPQAPHEANPSHTATSDSRTNSSSTTSSPESRKPLKKAKKKVVVLDGDESPNTTPPPARPLRKKKAPTSSSLSKSQGDEVPSPSPSVLHSSLPIPSIPNSSPPTPSSPSSTLSSPETDLSDMGTLTLPHCPDPDPPALGHPVPPPVLPSQDESGPLDDGLDSAELLGDSNLRISDDPLPLPASMPSPPETVEATPEDHVPVVSSPLAHNFVEEPTYVPQDPHSGSSSPVMGLVEPQEPSSPVRASSPLPSQADSVDNAVIEVMHEDTHHKDDLPPSPSPLAPSPSSPSPPISTSSEHDQPITPLPSPPSHQTMKSTLSLSTNTCIKCGTSVHDADEVICLDCVLTESHYNTHTHTSQQPDTTPEPDLESDHNHTPPSHQDATHESPRAPPSHTLPISTLPISIPPVYSSSPQADSLSSSPYRSFSSLGVLSVSESPPAGPSAPPSRIQMHTTDPIHSQPPHIERRSQFLDLHNSFIPHQPSKLTSSLSSSGSPISSHRLPQPIPSAYTSLAAPSPVSSPTPSPAPSRTRSTSIPTQSNITPKSKHAVPATWQPPRNRVYFNIHKQGKPKDQDYLCAGCGKRLGMGILTTMRYCEYTGKLYCGSCHGGDTFYIPARLLHDWDHRAFPVAKHAKVFLEASYREPLFDIMAINPTLYKKSETIGRIRVLRRQLKYLREFLLTCSRTQLLKDLGLDMQPYLATDVHMYSLRDLVRSTELLDTLRSMVEQLVSHVGSCDLCKVKGSVCEFCASKEIIYPFQLKIAVQCVGECKGVFHKQCYVKGKCPKCLRIARRKMVLAMQEKKMLPVQAHE
eukprot:TRINITY_DN7730_c0_g1_i8.p1 TRINITY_DN7730_c0_g1~~TRINITY_DN7730_c0_g1_i8.p1  ORF type:complete len:1000 (-),score=222.42 TRINITY_DN7730_c0_g1_i8:15-3014(-)